MAAAPLWFGVVILGHHLLLQLFHLLGNVCTVRDSDGPRSV